MNPRPVAYSRVMPFARFVMCMLVAVCAHSATAADLLGRYGLPVMQRFAAGTGIVLSAEYNRDGHVATVEIAPTGYQQREPKADLSMDRGITSELIDLFVPRERQQQMLNRLNCISKLNRDTGAGSSSCGLGQGDQDIAIQRSYTRNGDTERELVATITSKIDLPQTAITLESRFGPALVERFTAARFTAAPGIELTATYDQERTATEIAMVPTRSPLDADDQARFMPAPDLERILDETAPVWTRTGRLGGGSMQSGCNEIRIEEFDNLSITRWFHHCRLPSEDMTMQATVRWGPRRLAPDRKLETPAARPPALRSPPSPSGRHCTAPARLRPDLPR